MLRFLLLILGLAAGLPLWAEDSAEALVMKMVARDKVLVQHRALYTYTAAEVRQKLDEDGKLVSSTTTEEEIRGDKSPDYGTRKTQGMEADLKQASREEPFNILNIMDHYRYSLVGDEVIHGVLCAKVKFEPKPDQPYHNREEKVSNQLSGWMWIAKADNTLVRNEGKIGEPVEVAWFFATLTEMEFLFESSPLPNGELGPARITYRFHVSTLLGKIHERHIRTMKNYRVN